jgi:metallo-beta-lactamase family protein
MADPAAFSTTSTQPVAPESSVVLVGYQPRAVWAAAAGRVKRVKIIGEEVSVGRRFTPRRLFRPRRQETAELADQAQRAAANIFIVHAEPEQSAAFAAVLKERLGFPSYVPRFGDVAVIDGRSFTVEASGLVLIDPAVRELHELLEQLDSDYMEFRKRLEAVAAVPARLPALLRGVQRIRKFVRKTMEETGVNDNE